jgi:rhomboid protease GluP
MFLIVAVQDSQISSVNTDTLLQWGASYSPDVTQGAWWRLMTAVFLHGGILHLASNMFALVMIGSVTERLFGSTAFTVVYAIAGLGGAVASEWWHPVSVSVGASGAIFGLYGTLLAFLLLRHTTLPRAVVRSLGSGAAVVVLYNIGFGFSQPLIDNAAHLGGLISGFFAGLALTGSRDASNVTPSYWRSAQVACAGLVITAVAVAALPRYGDFRRNLSRFTQLDDATLDATQRSLDKVAAGELTEDECAMAIDRLLPPWRALRSTLAALHVPPSDTAVITAIVQYMDVRQYAWTLTADAMRKRDVTLLGQGQGAHVAAIGIRVPRSTASRRSRTAAGAITFGSSALNGELGRTVSLDDASTRLYDGWIAKARTGQMSLPDIATAVEKQIIVPWSRQYDRLLALPLHGPPDWTRKPLVEFMRRRLDAWRLTARAARGRDPLLMKEAMAAQQDAVAFLRASQAQRAR